MENYRLSLVICLLIVCAPRVIALGDDITAADLIELDFEELVNMNVEVESAGKNKTRAMDLPYAAFVISAKDIRSSGAQSIPDALRLAPGVLVGRISAGEWGVSIRGLGGRFSRFVLVMIDGRIAYNSAFSGVNWDELNITLSEIERIEVIRGPNAAAWGANAVNGIINIITRAPDAGNGSRANLWVGKDGRTGQSFAANLSVSDNLYWSLSGHVNQWSGLSTSDSSFTEDPHRDWRLSNGLKRKSERSTLQINVDFFGSEQSPEWSWINEEKFREDSFEIEEIKTGWVGQIKHEFDITQNLQWKSRLSIDQTKRENRLYSWDSLNYQLDTEISAGWNNHLFSAGVNTRYTDSDIISEDFFTVRLDPTRRTVKHYGVYLGDVYQASKSLQLSLAARLDRSQLSNSNIQPAARIMWSPGDNDRIWMAYSEASSTPSRAIVDLDNVPYSVIPANGAEQPYPVLLVLDGHTGKEKDVRLHASEVGYRKTFNPFSVDLTYFDFKYSDEVFAETIGDPEVVFADIFTPLYIRQLALFNNSRDMSSHGAEISVRAQPMDRWTSQLAISNLTVDREGESSTSVLSFLNGYSINPNLEINFNIRSVTGAENTSSRFGSEYDMGTLVDDYVLADININWSVNNEFLVSLIVNNIGKSHDEALREEFTTRVLQIEPYALIRLSYSK